MKKVLLSTLLVIASVIAFGGTLINPATGAGSAAFVADDMVAAVAPVSAHMATETHTDVTCNAGSDGSVTLGVVGGTGPFSYSIDGVSYVPTATFNGLTAGGYTGYVRDDADMSVSTVAIAIAEPAAITVPASITHVSGCNGGFNGAIDITPAGGSGVYTSFAWTGPGTFMASTEDISAPTDQVYAGTYNLTITDDAGCTADFVYVVNEPVALVADTVVTRVSCNAGNDASIQVNLTGGTANYDYQLYDGGGLVDQVLNTAALTHTFTTLPVATYTVIVTDVNGCEYVVSPIEITAPANLVLSEAITDVSCNGLSDGAIALTVAGGVAPYTYLWSNGAVTQNLTGVAAANYSVTVTDDNGCTVVGGPYTVAEPAVLTDGGAPTLVNPECNGNQNGSITITTTGGTPGYTYAWTGPNGYTASTENISGLDEGDYYLTITDDNGCTFNNGGAPYTLTYDVVISVAEVIKDNVGCPGGDNGEIAITASNGTAPYTYAWTGPNGYTSSDEDIINLIAGDYNLVVTDDNGCFNNYTYTVADGSDPIVASAMQTDVSCNGGNDGALTLTVTGGNNNPNFIYEWTKDGAPFASTKDISGLTVGVYEVTITDNFGCQGFGTYTIVEPTALTASAVAADADCNGAATGSVDLTAAGGTAPFTYLWSNGAVTEDLTNVVAGTYTVTVTDAQGCTTTASATVGEPTALLISSVTQTNVDCNGNSTGALDITVSGGTAPYTYLWSNTATTEDISGLAAGAYSVTVTDDNGCTVGGNYVITEPAVLTASASATPTSCNGGSDGTLSLMVAGGTPSYTYLWSNGAITQNLSGVAAGTYTVTVTDGNFCTTTASATVTEPTPITATINVIDVTGCKGGFNGELDITVNGGTAPYTYAWTGPNGFTSTNDDPNFSVDGEFIYAGKYYVTVTDNNACTYLDSAVVSEPDSVSAPAVVSNVSCFGANDGSIDVTTGGGTPPYTWEWYAGPVVGGPLLTSTEDLTNVGPGTYTLYIDDFYGCDTTKTFTVTEPALLEITSNTITHVLCFGDMNGAVDITVAGGTPPYTFAWTDGGMFSATTQNITLLNGGTYDVTITDDNGCTATGSYVVNEPAAPLAITFNITDATGCPNAANGEIDAVVTGGTPAYSYSWSSNVPGFVDPMTEDMTGLVTGLYTLTVTDGNNCILTETAFVDDPDTIQATITGTDITCFGDMDGAIDVTVDALTGTPPFTFLWTGPNVTGATTEDLSGLAAGTYSVVVEDNAGCDTAMSFTINEPAVLAASGTQVNVLCNGDATGSIDLTVTGGNGGNTFLWSNGATTEDLSNVVAGSYSVTVTDANLCQTTASFTITEPAALSASTSVTDSDCNGVDNGAIDLTVSGGASPYTYLWNTAAITEDLTNIGAGLYDVTITDDNGCTLTLTNIAVNNNSGLTVSGAITQNIGCEGADNAFIDLTVSGGSPSYTYMWAGTSVDNNPANNGSTLEDIYNLLAGTYTVTVTDATGCQASAVFVVEDGTSPATTLTAQVNASCNGVADGSIDVSVVDGNQQPSPIYAYSWSMAGVEFATTQDVSGLAAGDYMLVVSDELACRDTTYYTITEPAVLVSTANVITDNVCFGGTIGAVDVNVTGGTMPYTYLWSNGATTQDISNLAAGTYTLTVTDANNCTSVESYTVVEPTEISIVANTITDVDCNGNSTGAIDIEVTEGTAPYTFSWNNGAMSEDITGLAAGTYMVTVTDDNACTKMASFVVSEPTLVAGSATITNVGCNGASTGAINLTVSGGTPGYTYLWSNGETTQDLSGVAAGTYTVDITDANNCVLTQSYTVTEPAPLAATLNISDVYGCKGGFTGAINATVTGGTAPFTYVWTGVGAFTATTKDITSLYAGDYELTVTDAMGCTFVVAGTVGEPELVTASVSVTDVDCNGNNNGSIDIQPMGGTPGYTYIWNGPGVVNVTTQDLTGLAPGSYSVVIDDQFGCDFDTTVVVAEPAVLTATGLVTNVDCFGNASGSIDLTPAGGNGGYMYSWSNGAITEDLTGVVAGSYDVTITDAKGCTFFIAFTVTEPVAALSATSVDTDVFGCPGASTGAIDLTPAGGTSPYTYSWVGPNAFTATTEDINMLLAGTYTVIVTDDNGCQVTYSTTIIDPTIPVVANGVITDATCFGDTDGMIDVTVTGGTTPYTYEWYAGADILGTPFAFTEDLIDLAAGTYTVLVEDVYGCDDIMTFVVGQPDELLATAVSSPVSCNGLSDGSVDITVTGGNGGNTYVWSNGATTEDLMNVPAGSYSVTVTDAKACMFTATYTVVEPAPLVVSLVNFTDVSCFGGNDGAIDVTVTGGNGSYAYAWSNGAITEDIMGLVAGTYSVMVTDAKGCTASLTYTINEPAELLISNAVVNNVSCFAGNNGSINITVTGGNGTNTYAWSNGATTEDISGLVAGDYTVVITDIKGCTTGATYTVTEPAELIGSAMVSDVKCNGGADGMIDLTVTGGTMPYSYAWSNGATTEDISGLVAGSYSVVVTDANNCVVVINATVGQPAPIVLTETHMNVLCFGDATGSIDLTVNGGVMPYAYAWSNGAAIEDLSGLVAGTYDVTVTDANGCTSMLSVTITEPTQLLAPMSKVDVFPCYDGETGQASVSPVGGVAPYTVVWNHLPGTTYNVAANGTLTLTDLVAGLYGVTVTDANGCFTTSGIEINQPEEIIATGTVISNVSCNGNTDGAISVTAVGGTAPYRYEWKHNLSLTSSTLTNLAAGTYTVEVFDIYGCSDKIDVVVTEPALLVASIVGTDVSCFGANNGMADLTVTGGTQPYSYNWNSGVASTEDLANLAPGTYSVMVTDANGCTASASVTIGQPAAALSATATVNNVLCNGQTNGSIDLVVSGGSAPYTFAWTGGVNATAEDIANLGAGAYNVTITDAKGCTLTKSYTITEPNVLVASIDVTDVACNGAANGALNLTVTGGTAPYTYLWSNTANTQDITGLVAGNYTVTVTDANGCNVTKSATIAQPANISLSAAVVNVTCNGGSDGRIDLTVTGGSAPYTYSWNNGAIITEDIAGLNAGSYTVVVTDSRGCSMQATYTVSQFAPLAVVVRTTDVECAGESDGTAFADVTGGSGNYSFLWNTGSADQFITSLGAANYTVTVTDGAGCSVTATETVGSPAALSLSIQSTNETADNACNGEADLTVTGGTAPYDYLWSNGSTLQDITKLCPGVYTVVVTDANGCQTTKEVKILPFIGVEDIEAAITEVSVYPNPTSGAAFVQFNVNETTEVEIIVTDMTGAFMMAKQVTATFGEFKYEIDMSNYAKGMYLVNVKSAQGMITNRIAVQ